jgi:hypothetical protein
VDQQDREEHDKRSEENTGCVHKSDPSWRVPRQTGRAPHSLAEKPKVGELQMDWLRSEDLKEEKNVTAPIVIIAVHALCRLEEAAGVTRCNSPTRSCSSRSDFNLTIPNWHQSPIAYEGGQAKKHAWCHEQRTSSPASRPSANGLCSRCHFAIAKNGLYCSLPCCLHVLLCLFEIAPVNRDRQFDASTFPAIIFRPKFTSMGTDAVTASFTAFGNNSPPTIYTKRVSV